MLFFCGFYCFIQLLHAAPCLSSRATQGGAKMIRGVCMCLQLHYLPLKNVYISFIASFSVFLLAAAWLLGCPGKSSYFRQNVLCVLINACDSLFLLVKNGCIVSFCRNLSLPTHPARLRARCLLFRRTLAQSPADVYTGRVFFCGKKK